MIKKSSKLFLSFIASILLISTLSYDLANAQTSNKPNSDAIEKEGKQIKENIDPFFKLLDKLPDETANQGIEKSVEWFNANKGLELKNYHFVNLNGNLKLVKDNTDSHTIVNYSVAGCAGAIALAIAQNAIPWAKILKVKKAAKAAGGLQKMASKVVVAYQHQRNLGLSRTNAIKKAVSIASKAFPTDARQAFIELVGLGGVSAACFS